MLRVLIAHGGALGERLAARLQGQVLRVASAREAIEADHGTFDVLVVQRRLPDGDGVAVIESLLATGFTGGVLVIGDRSSTPDLVAVLGRGADDYVRQPADLDELAARVYALGRRATRAYPLVVGPLRLDVLERRAFLHGEELTLLAPREFALLEVLARARTYVSSAELARLILGKVTSARTHVHVIVCRARGKLGVAAEMLETRKRVGYRLRIASPDEAPALGTLPGSTP